MATQLAHQPLTACACEDPGMLIASPCVVRLSWRLEDAQGQLIDELDEPVEFYVGGQDLLSKVEQDLSGHAAGDELTIRLEPGEAFGDYDPELVFFEERALFSGHVEPGMQFDGVPEGATTVGMPADQIYTITEVYDSHVVLDGNHPLAGLAMRLQVKIHAVREATEAEIQEGSVAEPVFTLLHTAPGSDHLH